MKISTNDWNGYIRRLASLNQKAADRIQAWVERYGLNDLAAVTEYAYALASRYGEGAAELACELYDAIAAAQGVAVPSAVPAATAAYGDVARTVNGVLKQSAALVPSAVGRLVKQAGEDTTLQNALRDGAEFAWIPSGDTCPFCIMLASRGWQKASKKAIKNGHAAHIHSNCDCAYAIRFSDQGGVAGYDPERYLEQYYAAGGDINAMRRERYAQNKDLINGQKRAAYKKLHPVRGATDTGTEIVMRDGQRIPYGSRPGFNGMTREQAIRQAELYRKRPGRDIQSP